MRTFIAYKIESDYYRQVADWMGDFKRQTGKELEEVDPDSADGDMTCRTYDIVEYPSIVALDDNGVMQNMWKGLPLPTISEVSYYVQ
ncbi:MAG TPA: hypothetical protein VFK03_03980 [Candidatus Saccharimonadales bacterium]|nr:hypothetical protein [Candidatus Saccharimonadales bacterium]